MFLWRKYFVDKFIYIIIFHYEMNFITQKFLYVLKFTNTIVRVIQLPQYFL